MEKIDLTKDVKDIHAENYKTLKKQQQQQQQEDNNKTWKHLPCSWAGSINIKCPYY